MLSITAHIHGQYKLENNVSDDYWNDGEVSVSFWKVPYSTPDFNRIPVGARTLPIICGSLYMLNILCRRI